MERFSFDLDAAVFGFLHVLPGLQHRVDMAKSTRMGAVDSDAQLVSQGIRDCFLRQGGASGAEVDRSAPYPLGQRRGGSCVEHSSEHEGGQAQKNFHEASSALP